MTQLQSPPAQFGTSDREEQAPLKPHRGASVLVLGILGLVLCFILGIVAWAMGNTDLKEMDAGAMDPSGRSMTQAGRVCGMIGVILGCVWLIIVLMTVAGRG